VVFFSDASDLVPGDTNGGEGEKDVFVHDRQTGATERVNVASNGTQADGGSSTASISADGRYVAFDSDASNLVAGDTKNKRDVFVHDRQTGVTSRVSVANNGAEGNSDSLGGSISADGSDVAFYSKASNLTAHDTNAPTDVFVRDRGAGSTELVSVKSNGDQGTGFSLRPSISSDGRYVAFTSNASNLVGGADPNDDNDVFLHDRQTGATTRVSVAADGTVGNQRSQNPVVSADGTFVAFDSYASNLVAGDTNGMTTTDVFVHELGAPGTDTAAPNTKITGHPSDKTTKQNATFKFSGTDNVTPPASLSFECKLDAKAFTPCTSPAKYTFLKPRKHDFRVRASDQASNTDPTPAKYEWTIKN
jgi:Tol biopolymer transport system component